MTVHHTARLTAASCLLLACGGPSTPMAPTTTSGGGLQVADIAATESVNELPDWIVNPAALPLGRVGMNNCTFAFGQNVPQWDFHPDAGCWEHTGPDGWIRNQQQRVHVPQLPACGGGPGDANAIRVCLAPGLANPCFIDAVTGPAGCARCVVNPVCH
jgi:hypothetical protein